MCSHKRKYKDLAFTTQFCAPTDRMALEKLVQEGLGGISLPFEFLQVKVAFNKKTRPKMISGEHKGLVCITLRLKADCEISYKQVPSFSTCEESG